MFKEERINLFYPQIQELMYDFNKKYLKDKWEVLTDTGFIKSNSFIYLYKGNREIIISEIFEDRITNYGNFTMSEDILNDYFKVLDNIKPILMEYWYGGKEY